MSDTLKEKLKSDEEVRITTYTCGNCEGYFILLKGCPKPQFCPFCGNRNIGESDELKVKTTR